MDRRNFIKIAGTLTGLSLLAEACGDNPTMVNGNNIGASHKVGHLLHEDNLGTSVSTNVAKVAIIGGGVSGLSAARYLSQKGIDDVVVLDLEKEMGGNARCGANEFTKYPWGAHYIPLPNNNLTEYLSFLQEVGVITEWNKEGLPVYNEFYLCQDPEERLYINGTWQEGLIPKFGLSKDEDEQIQQFFKFVNECRFRIGSDGKDAFSIPVDDSSTDAEFRILDQMTMKDRLLSNKWDSKYLHWYVNYCTRDDFGTKYDEISAWTAIHYFAARKGKAANARYSDVLTWEEGNGFLVNHLKKNQNLINSALVTSVQITQDKVHVEYYDVNCHQVKSYIVEHCIVATPQFVSAKLLKDSARQEEVRSNFKYAPWMVANIQVGRLEERSGIGPCWDNVIYDSPALGYVDATHQQLTQQRNKRVLTYYRPLTHKNVVDARKEAIETTHEQWVKMILKDLKKVHTNIEKVTDKIDIMIWGHAMAQPLPGHLDNIVRKRMAKSIDDKIHFAHSDLAGISIFEEAFYQGIHAAQKIVALAKKNFK